MSQNVPELLPNEAHGAQESHAQVRESIEAAGGGKQAGGKEKEDPETAAAAAAAGCGLQATTISSCMLACSCRLDILTADHADAGGVKHLLPLIKPEASELKHLIPLVKPTNLCNHTL